MLDRLIPIEDERCQKNFEIMIELKRKKLGEIQVSDVINGLKFELILHREIGEIHVRRFETDQLDSCVELI